METTGNWWCVQCGRWFVGLDLEEATEHLETHGHKAERWPDGSLVVDMSDVPELLEEE